jgi:hypothetical protein
MEPQENALPFEFDPEAPFSPGVTTRSKTKGKEKKMLLVAGGSSLTELPNDKHVELRIYFPLSQRPGPLLSHQPCLPEHRHSRLPVGAIPQ